MNAITSPSLGTAMPQGSTSSVIPALFAERNRLFAEACEICDRLGMIDDDVNAPHPIEPPDDSWPRAARMNAQAPLRGVAFAAASCDAIHKEYEAKLDLMIEAEKRIDTTIAQSPLDLAIKVWLAISMEVIGPRLDPTKHAEPVDMAMISALHDLCRIADLEVIGVQDVAGGGYVWVGSRRGDLVVTECGTQKQGGLQ